MDKINYEIVFGADNGAAARFEFHGDNLGQARNHASSLLRDAKNDVKSNPPNFNWNKIPQGVVNAHFRKIGTTIWRQVPNPR
jgi:hypothetical protein